MTLSPLDLTGWTVGCVFFLFSSRIVLVDDAIDCLMSFSDFLYAFQLQFYFQGTIKSTVLYWLLGLWENNNTLGYHDMMFLDTVFILKHFVSIFN